MLTGAIMWFSGKHARADVGALSERVAKTNGSGALGGGQDQRLFGRNYSKEDYTMNRFRSSLSGLMVALVALPLSVFAAGGGGGGGGGGSTSWGERKPMDADMSAAMQAIDEKNWSAAVAWLEKSLKNDDTNADTYNYLGYAERHRGNMDAAFRYYEKALAINPKHKGAHEYVGEAYLMVGNVAKAEEHLAKLDKICFLSCDEFAELKTKIAEYKEKQAKK
jgi:tetratricopeptide (TPR) repeat protein